MGTIVPPTNKHIFDFLPTFTNTFVNMSLSHDGFMRQGTKYETTLAGQVLHNLLTALTIKSG